MTHFELCKRTAERFSSSKSFALYEVTMLGAEKPDVLVFDSSAHTWLYEIKMSRSDFLADKHKSARKRPHFGDYRFYVCAGDFIKPEELPEGWGLYYFKNNKFYKQSDSKNFAERAAGSFILRSTIQLLSNHIICEKKNIVFSPRVTQNRELYKKKTEDKNGAEFS